MVKRERNKDSHVGGREMVKRGKKKGSRVG